MTTFLPQKEVKLIIGTYQKNNPDAIKQKSEFLKRQGIKHIVNIAGQIIIPAAQFGTVQAEPQVWSPPP